MFSQFVELAGEPLFQLASRRVYQLDSFQVDPDHAGTVAYRLFVAQKHDIGDFPALRRLRRT